MSEASNPAYRLHALLSDIKATREANKVRMEQAWARVLGVNEDNPARLLRLVGRVLELPSEVRRRVRALSYVSPDVLLERFSEIETALEQLNFRITVQQFMQPISDASMHGLAICSDYLMRSAAEGTIPEEERVNLLDRVERLLEEVKVDESLDAKVRDYVCAHLIAVQDALEEVAVRGVNGLRDAMDRFLGATWREPDLVEKAKSTEVGSHFFAYMRQVAGSLSRASAPWQLTNQIEHALPAGETRGSDE